jgi:chloramphenicol-sensitive protein RarD
LPIARQGKTLALFGLTSVLLAANWLVYMWAILNNRVVDASLGYFINPLISVVLGVWFLNERMRLGQMVAVGLAFVGVLWLTLSVGALPWIGLTLGFSFGFYGLLRKTAPLNALEGLWMETALLLLFALGYLFYQERLGVGAFGHQGTTVNLLLILGGAVTSTPLLLFSAAARRIPLSLLGFLQYVAPTIQFLLGALLFGGTLSPARLLYSAEGLATRRRTLLLQAAGANS